VVHGVSKKVEKKEYEDIIRYQPIPIMIIKDEEMNQYLWVWYYSLVVRVMRKRPMTVREIEAAFNKQAEKEKYNEPKSDTTIYRYVKTLESVGLIKQAGRRVYFEGTKTEILYSRTARVFYYINLPDSYWKADAGKIFYERLFLAIRKIYDNHELDKIRFKEFVIKYERAKAKEISTLVSKLDDEALEDITEIEWWEILQVLRYAEFLGVMLNQPDQLDELKKCFKKNKP